MKTKPNKISILVVIAVLLLPITAFSQKSKSSIVIKTPIKLIARATSDSVILRWAPGTPGGWLVANSIGYSIDRLKVVEGKDIDNKSYEPLVKESVKPMTLDAWMKFAGPKNRHSAIAAQALYGKAFVPNPLRSDSLISLRNAADELSNRYSFALFAADNDAVTAQALGLRYVDRNVSANSRYIYRVYVSATSTEMAFDTAYIVVETAPFKGIDPPVGFNYRSGDASIQLIWPNAPNSDFTGYYLFRSDDGGKSFKPLNQTPIVFAQGTSQASSENILFIDTATVNYKPYKYRLVGITAFGEQSLPVEITAFSRDLTPPPAPAVQKPKQVAPGKIKLSWDYKIKTADLNGFVVFKSQSAENDYRLITSKPVKKDSRELVVDLVDDFEAYFIVASADTAGNLGYSSPILASLTETPVPIPPQQVKGNIDKTGKVTLTWKPVDSKNVIGYRIYRANDPSHEFLAVNGFVHPDTIFIDSITLNTLSKNIYYRVASVNSRYQYSNLSPILKLSRPDLIPPAPALISNIRVTDKSVSLNWNCSPSPDVALQRILRRTETDAKWAVIDSVRPNVNKYVDSRVNPKTTYLYTLVSVDSTGNVSKMANVVTARPYDNGIRQPVQNFMAEYNKQTKSVTLKWQYKPSVSTDYWFVIYRSTDDGNFIEIKALKPDVTGFTDNSAPKGTTTYGIVVMTSDGGQSEMVTQRIVIPE